MRLRSDVVAVVVVVAVVAVVAVVVVCSDLSPDGDRQATATVQLLIS